MDFISALKLSANEHKIKYIDVIPFFEKEGYSSVAVALLPYYAGEQSSYFSKYTRGVDYHIFGRTLFERILSGVDMNLRYEILIDISPFDEKKLAKMCGLGVIGRNGLLINPEYGSFVFILTAFLDVDIPHHNKAKSESVCDGCLKCLKACPSGAIGVDGVDYSVCISRLTQKKGITEAEAALIKKGGYAWGCDHCQNACPYNMDIPVTPYAEFKERLLLSADNVGGLSNREFLKKYADKAFRYKGRRIIERNINIILGE